MTERSSKVANLQSAKQQLDSLNGGFEQGFLSDADQELLADDHSASVVTDMREMIEREFTRFRSATSPAHPGRSSSVVLPTDPIARRRLLRSVIASQGARVPAGIQVAFSSDSEPKDDEVGTMLEQLVKLKLLGDSND